MTSRQKIARISIESASLHGLDIVFISDKTLASEAQRLLVIADRQVDSRLGDEIGNSSSISRRQAFDLKENVGECGSGDIKGCALPFFCGYRRQ